MKTEGNDDNSTSPDKKKTKIFVGSEEVDQESESLDSTKTKSMQEELKINQESIQEFPLSDFSESVNRR